MMSRVLHHDDPVETASIRTRLLLLFCTLSLVVNSLYAFALWTQGEHLALGIATGTLFILIGLFIHTWKRGWRRWAAVVYLVSAVLKLILHLFVQGEMLAAIMIWIPFIPMLAMLLLDRKDGVLLTLLSALGISFATVWEGVTGEAGTLGDVLSEEVTTLFSILIASLATLGVILVYVRVRDIYADRQQREREAKEVLLRILSHDVANQLMAIQMSAAMSRENSEKVHDSLKVIQDASDRMADMLGAVRTMSALEDGKLKLTLSPVPISDALEDAVKPFAARAKQKNITLRVVPPAASGDHPLTAWCDRKTLVYNVLANLLSNAIKFTPQGGIIRVEARQVDSEVHVSVCDNGVGVPGALLPHIFDTWRPTSRTGTQNEAGTGFGLPLVRTLVERYGGTIEVKSDTGPDHPGTTFTIRLRAAEP